MTAIGINASAFNSQAGSFVSVTVSQVSVSDRSDFSNLFTSKLQASQNDTNERTITAIKTTKTEYSKEQAKTQDAASNVTPQNAVESKAQPATEDVKETQALDETQTATELSEDVTEDDLAEVIEILNTIMQGIANILETTLRELQGSFEQINLLPKDLTDTDKLAQLVLNINQCSDMSDMLVDSDMLDAFNQIKELVTQVLEDFGYTEIDFDKVTNSDLFAELMSTQNIKGEDGMFKMPEVKADDAGNGKAEVEAPGEEAFTVEITRTGASESKDSNESGEQNNTLAGSFDRTETESIRRDTRTTTTPAENFVGHIENAVKTLDIEMPVTEGVTVRDIVYQLVDEVKINISPDNTSMEMSLNPESLGRVSLNITQKDGAMTAHITTENQISKEALESQLQILKDTIEAQGIKVDAIEVTVSSYIFSDSKNAESSEEEQSGNRFGRKGLRGVGENEAVTDSEAERLQQEVMLQTGSTVNYVA